MPPRSESKFTIDVPWYLREEREEKGDKKGGEGRKIMLSNVNKHRWRHINDIQDLPGNR